MYFSQKSWILLLALHAFCTQPITDLIWFHFSVMDAVWVHVWRHSTDKFTARTRTVPKSPPRRAMDSGGKHPFHNKSCLFSSTAPNILMYEWIKWDINVFPRPTAMKNCSTDACALHWHVGPWTRCTATCGRHGFQSRRVTCKHRRTNKTTREHQCTWRPRPPSWQRCNIVSCDSGEEKVTSILHVLPVI